MHRHPRLAGATGLLTTLAVATAALAQPVGGAPTAAPQPPPVPTATGSASAPSAPETPPSGSAAAVASPPPSTPAPAPSATASVAEEPESGPPPRPTRERSATLAATGGLMVGFGFIGVVVGGGLVALGLVEQGVGTCTDGVYGYSYHCGIGETGEDMETAGLVTMAVGGAVMLVGIPIIYYGATTVPRDEQSRPRTPRPELRIGARSVGLSVPF